MYPFGSGMPSLPNNQSYNPSHNNMPFGAGFQPPSNNNQPRSGNTPYPISSSQQTPYPQYPSGNTYQTPYPNTQTNYYNQSPYASAYPSTNPTQYPTSPFGAGFQIPRNQQPPQQQQPSYYSAGANNPVQQQSPYGQQQCPYPSIPSSTSVPYPTNSHPHPQTQGIPNASVSPQQNQHKMNYNMNMSKCITEMRSSMVHGAKKAGNQGNPTVFPNSDFDAVKDAHALRKAMKGFGTDEDALINIICRRTNTERLEIQRQYKTHFGKDLIEDIKSETSGNFQNLLVGLLRPIVDFYLRELCEAMTGVGTDEDVLVEVMCTLSNAEIQTIKHAYLRVYGRHLESEFKSETSGNFKRLLVSLCNGQRDESNYTDLAAAQNDAKELLKAGELRVGTDESMFNQILCSRNYEQLRLIFQEYQNITGHTLEKAIKHEFSGDIKDGLLAIYKCVTNKYEFFASRLHKSMAGIGTDDQQLIRIIVTRCEIDMQDIKSAFERKYGKSLKSWIKGDTSGHYKHALYALIGEERSS